MGHRNKRKGFNPNDKKPENLGNKIVNSLDSILARTQAIVRDDAIKDLARRIEQRESVGEAIVNSIANAYTGVAFSLKREMSQHKGMEELREARRLAKEAKEKTVEALARAATDAAFPGIEDD